MAARKNADGVSERIHAYLSTQSRSPLLSKFPEEELKKSILTVEEQRLLLLHARIAILAALIDYRVQLVQKYERAALRPWETVEADPPPPDANTIQRYLQPVR
jgi:hypothetical protein